MGGGLMFSPVCGLAIGFSTLVFFFSSAGVARGRSSVRGGGSGYGSAGSAGSRTSRGSSIR